MTKKDFITAVAERTGATKKDTTLTVDTMLDVISEILTDGDEINFKGFGKFCVTERPEKMCRNPKTGEEVLSKAHNVCKFKPSSHLKELVY